jgi:hypothetical protein
MGTFTASRDQPFLCLNEHRNFVVYRVFIGVTITEEPSFGGVHLEKLTVAQEFPALQSALPFSPES